jgi:hypothetical protein
MHKSKSVKAEVLIWKPSGNKPLRRNKHRPIRDDYFRINIRGTASEDMTWILLVRNKTKRHAFVTTILNFWIQQRQEIP